MTSFETILGAILGLGFLIQFVFSLRAFRNGERNGWTPDQIGQIEEAFRRLQMEWTDTIDKLTAWERRDRRRAQLSAQASVPESISRFRSQRMRDRAAQRDSGE